MTGRKRYWLFQLLGWTAFLLMHLFFAWSFGKMTTWEEQKLVLSRVSGFVLIGVTVTHFMRFSIFKSNTFSKTISQQISILIIITFIGAIVSAFLEFYGYALLDLRFKSEITLANKSTILSLINNTIGWFTYLLLWSAIYFIYHFVAYEQKQKMDTLQLKSLVKDLELNTIKAHINPHFIFNALNGIRALVEENPSHAREAITQLSNILRSSITVHKKELVSLEDELSIVKDYLALEQMRFEDRLRVEYDISEASLDNKIPPMILQTLVENAIKHGIAHQIKGGLVKISSKIIQEKLELKIENTGQLEYPLNENGFGIESTNERISLMYGSEGSFELKDEAPNIVSAKIVIPSTI